MAEGFRRLETLPPLRLTVHDIAEVGDDLTRQLQSGGRVGIEYAVSFADGTTFARDSSDGFLSNLDSKGEMLDDVRLQVTAWGQDVSDGINKHVQIDFRNFGSQFQVSSNDPLWGKGALQTIKARVSRYRPWYSRLIGWFPSISGILTVLPPVFIVAAVAHERSVTPLLITVVFLSTLLFLGNIWAWRQYMKRRLFAHTIIARDEGQQNWALAKVLLAGVAFLADLATLAVLLAR